MKALFVVWQDADTRRWIPVGRLTQADGTYEFTYTQGANESKNFVPFGRMTDLNAVYVSTKLFPLFANRILPKSRPEYRDYLRWLGLDDEKANELEVLARSGGQRATDTLEIIPCPEPTLDNRYVAYFFAHGIRHLTEQGQVRVSTLKHGEHLFLMRDVQNQADTMAILMRTVDPVSIVGYCSAEFSTLLEKVTARNVMVRVEQVNPDAPSQMRLLCRLEAPWPSDFSPCSHGSYEPLSDQLVSQPAPA